MRLGFVVASRGWNSLIDSKSPVSATTTVNFFNCSSLLGFVSVFVSAAMLILMGLVSSFPATVSCTRWLREKVTAEPRERQRKSRWRNVPAYAPEAKSAGARQGPQTSRSQTRWILEEDVA